MENYKLQDFLNLVSKVNVIIFTHDHLYDLVMYNNMVDCATFKRYLEKKGNLAFYSHLNNQKKIKGGVKYFMKCLQNQLAESMSDFFVVDGHICHKRMCIKDKYQNSYLFDNLPINLKVQISSFIAIQQQVLFSLSEKICHEKNEVPELAQFQYQEPGQPSGIKWLSTKTNIVELGNALFEGGYMGSISGSISKKEFMQSFSKLLGVELSSSEKILNKVKFRDNPSQFLDELKCIMIEYCNKKIN